MIGFRTAFLALAIALPTAALAEEEKAYVFACTAIQTPVVSLDHGSRYAAKDKSRSEFDEACNADVNAQLPPVDDFISALSAAANQALRSEADRQVAVDCVLTGLATWAKADALSDLTTMNANLSKPPRLVGIAFAYAQIMPLLSASDDRALVERWLAERAHATMAYFDTDAPPKTSRNNLRAWAALGVARIGLTVGDAAMVDWADASVRLVVCDVAADGSLPLEMARKELALHYQVHAVAPLVVTAALLQAEGHDLFRACDNAIHRAVRFVVPAFDDPALVTGIAGHAQTYFNGKEDLRGFEMAWAHAYLTLFYAPALAEFTQQFGQLGNSKLGGRQSLLWGV